MFESPDKIGLRAEKSPYKTLKFTFLGSFKGPDISSYRRLVSFRLGS